MLGNARFCPLMCWLIRAPAEEEDKLMPIIDRWTELKRQLGG